MDQFLADFDVETRIRVLKDDVLFRFEQGFAVEGVAGAAGFGEGVDVCPFVGAAAVRGGVPFLAEGVVEGFVREEGEELFGGRGFEPGVLVSEDVGLEMVFEEVEASARI